MQYKKNGLRVQISEVCGGYTFKIFKGKILLNEGVAASKRKAITIANSRTHTLWRFPNAYGKGRTFTRIAE